MRLDGDYFLAVYFAGVEFGLEFFGGASKVMLVDYFVKGEEAEIVAGKLIFFAWVA